MATGITTHTPVTTGGTVTVFAPLITHFPSVSGCSRAILYEGLSFAAFDPDYGISVDNSLTCLPQEITLWQNQINPGPTVTYLGPLTCPDMYTTASTSIVNSLTTHIACCPNSYAHVTTMYGSEAGWQCSSAVTIGQTLSFYQSDYSFGTYYPNTTVFKTLGPRSSVNGLYINGFIFADSATAITTSNPYPAGATIPQTPMPTPVPTTSSLATTSAPAVLLVSTTSSSSGLSTSAKIGVGVGTSLAALGFLSIILSLFLLRRSRKKSKSMRNLEQGSSMETCALKPTPELPNTESFNGRGGQRISGLTEVAVASPKVGSGERETVWEEGEGESGVVEGNRNGNRVVEGEGRSGDGEGEGGGVHEMGATLRAPFSDS